MASLTRSHESVRPRPPVVPEYSAQLADFLAAACGLPPEVLMRSSGWAGSGNSIGALALRLGVLSLDQVEQVVDLQAADGEPFGELAESLGFCEPEQTRCLLALQHAHRCLDQAGRLLLDGEVDLPRLLRLLADFVERERDA